MAVNLNVFAVLFLSMECCYLHNNTLQHIVCTGYVEMTTGRVPEVGGRTKPVVLKNKKMELFNT